MTEREKIISIIRPIIKEQYLMRCKEPDGCDNCWISCSVNERAKALADALIAANIGDITAWKERVEKAEKEVAALHERAKRFKIVVPMGTTVNSFGSELYRTQPNPYGVKQLYSDEEVEQIVKERDSKEEAYNKCYFDYRYWKDKAKEYKHRAEVAERALARLCDETMRDIRIIMYPNIGKLVRDKQELYDYCIEKAERELAEEGQ